MKYKTFITLCVFCLSSAFTTDKKNPITIFMIGDSTMANKSFAKGNIERGWGQMLPDFLTDEIIVSNHAKNGRSSLSFINEGHWDKVVSKLKKGDYVFIQFGHNDEKIAKELHTDPGSTFDDNLRRFVRETREKGAYPVLFNSIVRRNFPPRGVTEYQGRYKEEGNVLMDTHRDYLTSPRKVAQEMKLPFIDLNQLTHELVVSLGKEKSKELFMWVPAGKYEFCPKGRIDNTHLNIYGAKVVANIAIKAVIQAVPELARYARPYDSDVYVADYKDNKKCAISYTFDDGLLEHYTLVYPQLEKLGFKGTFWVCGKIIEDKIAARGKPRMTWEQMKEMASKGHEISNHSWSHPNFKRLTEREIKNEIKKNDSIIEAKIGEKPLTFCYPANSYHENIVQIASENRIATRLKQYPVGGDKSKTTPEKLEKWIDELIILNGWGTTMTHGITYGYDSFTNADILWNHLKTVKDREHEIWVGTFRKVGAYIKERRNIQLEVVKKKSSYIITPHLALNSKLFAEPLTMVLKTMGKTSIRVKQGKQKLSIKQIGEEVLFDFNPYGEKIKVSFVCTDSTDSASN